MMKFGLAFLVLLLPSLQTPEVHGNSDIAVRLIFLNGGKPAGGQQIILYEGDPKVAKTPQIKQTTGPDGVARFHLEEPIPETVWVYDDNGRIESCALEHPLSLQEVLTVGATVGVDERFGRTCTGNRGIVTRLGAKRGEIVIFVRKVTGWENLRHY